MVESIEPLAGHERSEDLRIKLEQTLRAELQRCPVANVSKTHLTPRTWQTNLRQSLGQSLNITPAPRDLLHPRKLRPIRRRTDIAPHRVKRRILQRRAHNHLRAFCRKMKRDHRPKRMPE